MPFVYIIQSQKTLEFYKGQTENISQRILRHNKGIEKATKHGVPWVLIWFTEKHTRSEAILLERKLKNLSRKRILQFIEKYSENSLSRVLTIPDLSIKGQESQDADIRLKVGSSAFESRQPDRTG